MIVYSARIQKFLFPQCIRRLKNQSFTSGNISCEKGGAFNEEYCKWCYADGEYTLDFFAKYRGLGGKEKFEEFKQQLIHKFNTLLHIEGLPNISISSK